jgi:hypothetical protein
MPLSLIVFDDFYEDPQEVRQAALKLDYPTPQQTPNYPGRNSHQPIIIGGIEQMVSKIVNEPVLGARNAAHCYFRVAMAEDDTNRKYDIHIDPEVIWTGILYLTLPEHCQGGTEFYRHKETESDRAAIYPDELKAVGARNFGDAGDPIIQRDSTDKSKWEHLTTVPMRFNRLVLLRPWFWHTAGRSFGSSIENCRLIQLFAFVPARR